MDQHVLKQDTLISITNLSFVNETCAQEEVNFLNVLIVHTQKDCIQGTVSGYDISSTKGYILEIYHSNQ